MKITNGNTVNRFTGGASRVGRILADVRFPTAISPCSSAGRSPTPPAWTVAAATCSGSLRHSSLPQVQVYRARPGLQVVPAVLGMASTSDAAIGFRVLNPGSFPLYGKRSRSRTSAATPSSRLPERRRTRLSRPDRSGAVPGELHGHGVVPHEVGTQGGTLALQLMALGPEDAGRGGHRCAVALANVGARDQLRRPVRRRRHDTARVVLPCGTSGRGAPRSLSLRSRVRWRVQSTPTFLEFRGDVANWLTLIVFTRPSLT